LVMRTQRDRMHAYAELSPAHPDRREPVPGGLSAASRNLSALALVALSPFS